MTKSFAFFIFCWGDTPSILILFQNLCDHFDCGLERCVLQISNITSQTNRNSHTYQEVLSEWSSDYSEHARSQHCDVSYYVQRLWKESKQTNNKPLPLPLSAKQWKSFLRFHPRSDGRAVSLLVKGCWSCSCGSCWSAADADAGPQTQMSTLTQACCEDAWLLHAHTLLALLLLADFSVQECKGTLTGNYFFFLRTFSVRKKGKRADPPCHKLTISLFLLINVCAGNVSAAGPQATTQAFLVRKGDVEWFWASQQPHNGAQSLSWKMWVVPWVLLRVLPALVVLLFCDSFTTFDRSVESKHPVTLE